MLALFSSQLFFVFRVSWMKNGELLSPKLQERIFSLCLQGKRLTQIAEFIGIHLQTVKRHIERKFMKRQRKITKNVGAPLTISPQKGESIHRKIDEIRFVTDQKIGREMYLPFLERQTRTIIRWFCLRHEKTDKSFDLNEKHMTDRLEFGKRHINLNVKWIRIFFADENAFNLNGHDGS